MWRMNGLWKGMAVALVLCALLLNNGVMCQEDDAAADATAAPAVDSDATGTTAAPGAPDDAASDATAPPDAADTDATVPVSGDSPATPAPGDGSVDATIITIPPAIPNVDSQGGAETSGTLGPAIVSMDATKAPAAPVQTKPPARLVVADVTCVDNLDENNAVKAVLQTANCEETKKLIEKNPAQWCSLDSCRLNVFQDGKTALISSPDAKLSNLAEVLRNEPIKGSLGVSEVETPPSSSGSSVFVAVLLSGLVLAAALIGGYCLKTRREGDAKGVRLAEEAYPADDQNQGNTLVSVAPLNPPPETQEKPSVNGESPEAAKTEPPPTNGQATAKTADTEL